MFTGPSESLLRLVAKYGGICHLCHGQVRLDVEPTHPEFPSRDHMIPRKEMVIGTTGKYLLAHRHCNSHRGHKSLTACQEAVYYHRQLQLAILAYQVNNT